MQFKKSDNFYLIRLEKEESFIEEISKLCEKEEITSAFFTAIGALSSLTISFYNLERKEYLDKNINEDCEIASLTGNVAIVENKPFVHAHGVFSNRNFECFGGHIKKGIVGATCEIHLTKLDMKAERTFDDFTGLKLLDCKA